MAKIALGIDIGGSGIKGAPVDVKTGEFTADRYRIPTPQPSTPKAVSKTVAEIVAHFDLPKDTPVGVTFPAPMKSGVIQWMANLDQSWTGQNANKILSKAVGRPVTCVNDADGAGYAEAEYGAAGGKDGTIFVSTLGTGIGTALIVDHQLVQNAELGHIYLPNGKVAEKWASAAVREREKLDFPQWATRLTDVYREYEKLFSPDLFIVGGGVSKKADQFLHLIDIQTPIVPATLFNTAGIVGAAALAYKTAKAKAASKKKK